MDLKYLMSLEIFLNKYIQLSNYQEYDLIYMERMVEEYKEFMNIK